MASISAAWKNVITPSRRRRCKALPRSIKLPEYNVLLHNDKKNTRDDVVKVLVEILHHDKETAKKLMWRAERQKKAVVFTTHKEEAEFKRDQLRSKSLTVDIEPVD